MNIVSFNANGLRARTHQLKAIVDRYSPDIIGIQEIKVSDDQFPGEDINALGYEYLSHGQKGHYGVALLYKLPLLSSTKGFAEDDEHTQKRLISALFQHNGRKIRVINGYFPQGESRDHPDKFPNKRRFYEQLLSYLKEQCHPDEEILLMGDMNVAPSDDDIGIGADNARRWIRTGKCCFLPEEREWLASLCQWGLTDTFRHFFPTDCNAFSWFDYRSRGFEREPKRGLRIDFILASDALLKKSTAAGIDYEIRSMDKPSDHCPIWLSIK